MTTFLQLHLLTAYPPACLNRDDLNRPKTVVMGGVPRLRISSQSLKRAWRVSEVFREKLSGETGIRSKELGRRIKESLLTGTPLSKLLQGHTPSVKDDERVGDQAASEWAWTIAFAFIGGKETNVSKATLKSEQVVFYSRDELDELENLVSTLREGKNKAPSLEQLAAIKKKEARRTADLALFGRMLAASPEYNVEAACQVAHAITVHRAVVEDDFFTAVDDLNTREEDAGSAHMGEQGFGAGLFYIYLCIDCGLLNANLCNDEAAEKLAAKTIKALCEAAATVAPTGKQNSFASRAWAYYGLAEKGSRQPRSLSLAFMKPVSDKGEGMLVNAVDALETMRNNMDMVYYGAKEEEDPVTSKKIRKPKDPLPSRHFFAAKGEGDFQELIKWAAGCEDE